MTRRPCVPCTAPGQCVTRRQRHGDRLMKESGPPRIMGSDSGARLLLFATHWIRRPAFQPLSPSPQRALAMFSSRWQQWYLQKPIHSRRGQRPRERRFRPWLAALEPRWGPTARVTSFSPDTSAGLNVTAATEVNLQCTATPLPLFQNVINVYQSDNGGAPQQIGSIHSNNPTWIWSASGLIHNHFYTMSARDLTGSGSTVTFVVDTLGPPVIVGVASGADTGPGGTDGVRSACGV